MPLEDVRAEARRLGEAGYRELVVTGIHLASYGRETGDTLLSAVRAVHDAPGVDRVRLGSLEPVVVDEAFCEGVRTMPRLCPQFHIALQSGCDAVLKRMRRRYTTAEFERAVADLRAAAPGCAITTDILTGFPGETDDEADETLRFVEKIGFARIHVFPYSRRKGTLADRMPDQVPEPVKKARTEALIALGNRLEAAYVKETVGTKQRVLFEDDCEGYTPQYVRVRANGTAGRIMTVRVTAAEGALARGEVLPDERSV